MCAYEDEVIGTSNRKTLSPLFYLLSFFSISNKIANFLEGDDLFKGVFFDQNHRILFFVIYDFYILKVFHFLEQLLRVFLNKKDIRLHLGISFFKNVQLFGLFQVVFLEVMSHLLPEYRWFVLDYLLKLFIAEDIGKKGVVDHKIKLYSLASFFVPFLPFFACLIDFISQFLQCCLRNLLEFLLIEEPVLLDAHLKFGQVRIAFPLHLFSNFAQTPLEGLFFKVPELSLNQLSEHTRKFFKLFLIII